MGIMLMMFAKKRRMPITTRKEKDKRQ